METKARDQVAQALQNAFYAAGAEVRTEYAFANSDGLRRFVDILVADPELGYYVVEVRSFTASDLLGMPKSSDFLALNPIRAAYDQSQALLMELFDTLLRKDMSRGAVEGEALVALPNVVEQEWDRIAKSMRLGSLKARTLFKEDVQYEDFGIIASPNYSGDYVPPLRRKLEKSRRVLRFGRRQVQHRLLPEKHNLFINYRRVDSNWAAGRVSDKLKHQFGDSDVFFDIANISGGRRFKQVIEERIRASSILLSVIGDKWLISADPESGRRRLDDANDYVKWEIALALQNKLEVIPLLIDDARLPRKEHLPRPLQELVDLNARHIRAADFDADMQRLIDDIRMLLRDVERP